MSSTSKIRPQPEDVKPLRFALKFSPPTVLLEYSLQSSGKIYHYCVKLNRMDFNGENSENKVVAKLRSKYDLLVKPGLISNEQLRRLIERLFAGVQSSNSSNNKQHDVHSKSSSNTSFRDTEKKPTVENIDMVLPPTPPSTNQSKNSQNSQNVFEKYADESINLNKMNKQELDLVKAEMSVEFEKKRLRPGDEGYKYDVQVDFEEGTEENDWDDDESTDIEENEDEEEFDFDFVNGDSI